jgi:hypothetical protein
MLGSMELIVPAPAASLVKIPLKSNESIADRRHTRLIDLIRYNLRQTGNKAGGLLRGLPLFLMHCRPHISPWQIAFGGLPRVSEIIDLHHRTATQTWLVKPNDDVSSMPSGWWGQAEGRRT